MKRLTKIDFDSLFSFFELPPVPLIGVDITSSSIKMVELSKKRNGGIVLEAISTEPVPPGVFNDQGIDNIDLLGVAIEAAWKKLGSKIKNVAVSIPTNAVITKRTHLSNQLDDKQLAEEVMIEANQYIPFPIEEVNVDWKAVGPYHAVPGDDEILICAARKERIEDYEAAVQAAGLKAVIVDVEIFAQQKAFSLLSETHPEFLDKVIAVVDGGSSLTNINIIHGNSIIFSKDIPFGSQQLTDNIVSMYGISHDEAEAAKIADGEGLDGYEENALFPFLQSFSMEANRAVQFFLTQATVEKIDYFLLSGGCASLLGITEAMVETTQTPTVLANPFEGMELTAKAKTKNVQKLAPLLMTACGLAMRRFD